VEQIKKAANRSQKKVPGQQEVSFRNKVELGAKKIPDEGGVWAQRGRRKRKVASGGNTFHTVGREGKDKRRQKRTDMEKKSKEKEKIDKEKRGEGKNHRPEIEASSPIVPLRKGKGSS